LKREFWCLICLGNATVSSAGGVTTAKAPSPERSYEDLTTDPEDVPVGLVAKVAPYLSSARLQVADSRIRQRRAVVSSSLSDDDEELLALGLAFLAQAFRGWDALKEIANEAHGDRVLLDSAVLELLGSS
jgi:hypothetical protein